MQLQGHHAIEVDLDLLARENVAVPDFKVALGDVQALVNQAINRLSQHFHAGTDLSRVFVGHSGGKDSCLVYHLTGMTFGHDRVQAFHTPKLAGPNVVHPLTRQFLYSRPFPVLYYPGSPKAVGFDAQIDGTRIHEAERTNGRSTTVVFDGQEVPRTELSSDYTERGIFDLKVAFPIVDWTDAEVWAVIHTLKIPYSLEYLEVLNA